MVIKRHLQDPNSIKTLCELVVSSQNAEVRMSSSGIKAVLFNLCYENLLNRYV